MIERHEKWWESIYQKLVLVASSEAQSSCIAAMLNLAGQLNTASDGKYKCTNQLVYILYILKTKSITSLCCLCYLVPDARSKADHETFVQFILVCLLYYIISICILVCHIFANNIIE